jgi:predicted dienelactone hydrolase
MRLALLVVMAGCADKGGAAGGDVDTAAGTHPDDEASTEGFDWPVDTPGPYATGYRTWDLSYDPGLGEGERTVRLNLWYPTEDTDGGPPTYTVGATDDLAILDAALAPSVHGGHYPVHVYSHGHQGWGATSVFLARYLASHGWITVAPDHTDNTLLDNVSPKPTDIYIHRATDISAALDAIAALPTSDPLSGLADTDAVMLSGHSFGAYTTWAVGGATLDMDQIQSRCDNGEVESGTCTAEELERFAAGLGDSRVVAAVPMAGSYGDEWFGADGYRAVHAPYLFMSGSNDSVGQTEQWDQLTDIDLTWIELAGGCHQSFALGTCATLDADTGFHVVQTYALAFGRSHVLADADATVAGILNGSIEVATEVTFQRR